MVDALEKAYEIGASFLLIVLLAYAVKYYQDQLAIANEDEAERVSTIKEEYQARIIQLEKERDDWRDKYMETVEEKERQVRELNERLRRTEEDALQRLLHFRDRLKHQQKQQQD